MIQQNQFSQILGEKVENWLPRKRPTKQIIQGIYCSIEVLDVEKHGNSLFDAFQLNNPGDTWTYLPFGPFTNSKEFKKWLQEASKSNIYYCIFDEENSSPQGIASYRDIDVNHGVIEVGSIHFSKLLQKTRAATEAIYLMINYVFEELGYRRCQWRCNTINQESCKAAERFGFKLEGIFRQYRVFKGYNWDVAWYSIIDCEWPALKIKFQKWLDPNNFDKQGKQKIKLQEM